VTFETKLPHRTSLQHLRIRRTVRCVTRGATLDLEWCVFENERALFVAVALDTRGVGADGKLCLLLFESAVRIMTIAAVHRAFEYFVMERLAELSLCFGMTRHAELGLVRAEHRTRRLSGFLMCDVSRKSY
jgi:hypothetical protein